MIWIILCLFVMYLLMRPTKDDDKYDIIKVVENLRDEILNEETRDRVEQLFRYHHKRVRAGANAEESIHRLYQDLQGLKSDLQES